MKKAAFLIATLIALASISVTSFGQKRPVRKTPAPISKPKVVEAPPEVEAAPVKIAVVEVFPAQGFFTQGLKCEAKDYDCQISNYTKAINLQLNTKAVFQKRAAAYAGRQDFGKAIDDLTKAIEFDLNDASGFKDRGKAYLGMPRRSQNIQNAIKDFTSAIDLEPKDVEAYKLRGSTYLNLGMSDKGIADIDKALSIEPNNVDLNLVRAQTFLASKDSQKAIDALTKIIALRPTDAELYNMRANAYLALGNADKASADFDKAISLEPGNLDAQLNRVNAFLRVKNYPKAIQGYDKMIADKPANPDLFEARGRVYQRQRKFDLAEKDFLKSIELRPANITALMTLADIYEKWRKWGQARETYSKAILLDPSSGKLYLKRANTSFMTSRLQEGLSDLNKSIEVLPNFAEAYEARCANLSSFEKDLALSDCNKAINLNPNSEYAYLLRGSLNFQKDENGPAFQARVESWRKNMVANATSILDKDPDNLDALIKRAGGYRDLKLNEKAVADFSRAIELDEFAAEAYFGRGMVEGSPNAVNDLIKGLELNPHSNLGVFLSMKVKDVNEGIVAYSRLIELHPTSANLYMLRGNFIWKKPKIPRKRWLT